MASEVDHQRFMKIDKSHYDVIKKAIFEASQNLGSGTTNAVPYDTAWVARIPKMGNLSSPAFPECLQWLRDHQKKDGRWGAEHPHSLHSDILNTFTALLALGQWNYPEDEERMKKANQALAILAKKLPQIETREKIFEMIMSGLLDDARELKLIIPYEQFDWCSKIGQNELQKIELKLMSNRPNKYWAVLEAASRTLDLEFESFRPEITRFGLIAAQPSSTAFILRFARLRGSNFLEAEWALKKVCAQNGGGVPHFGQCDNFEIIYGLDFLFKSGINPKVNIKHAVTENALKTLKGRLESNDGIGFSSNWQISDSECLLTALRVVHQGSKRNTKQEDGGEVTPTKKSNISIERGLHKSRPDLLEENEVSNQIDMINDGGLKEVCSVDKAFLAGKRNVSMHYSTLQTVFDLTYESKNVTEIIELISGSQNKDGGWGEGGTSTIEETAYVCLAIFRLVETQDVIERINFSKLTDFMTNVSNWSENECCWCFKVNFCSPAVADALISAAKHALFQIQRLRVMTDILNESLSTQFLTSEPWNVSNEIINPGQFLIIDPEFIPRQELEANKIKVMKIFNGIFQTEIDDRMRAVIDSSAELSYLSYPEKLSPYDRAVETSIIALYFVVDYVIDVVCPKLNISSEDAEKFLNILCDIIKGEYAHPAEVPTRNVPKFSLLAKWCFSYRKMMEEKGWQADTFVKYTNKKMFKGYFLGYKLERYGIDCTPKRYLQIHTLDIGNEEFSYTRCVFAGKPEGMAEFEQSDLFVKFIHCADKIGRLHGDISTIAKDVRSGSTENYCIKLRDENKISLQEAASRANRKCNREILKLLCLKKLILKDPKLKDNQTLHFVVRLVEYGANAGLLWCLNSTRYDQKTKFSISRDYDRKFDLSFVRNLCYDQNE